MTVKSIVVTYGSGGHQEQIRRLMQLVNEASEENVQFIAITDSEKPVLGIENITEYYYFLELRDKRSTLKTLVNIFPTLAKQIVAVFKLWNQYKPVGVISTGPGVSILPTVILKMLGVKTVAFESWSRFSEPSFTGKLLNRLVCRFYVQNESIKKVYKSAHYRGRL